MIYTRQPGDYQGTFAGGSIMIFGEGIPRRYVKCKYSVDISRVASDNRTDMTLIKTFACIISQWQRCQNCTSTV